MITHFKDEKQKEGGKPVSFLDDIAEQSEGVPKVVVDRENGRVLIDGRVVTGAYRVPLQTDFVMASLIEDLTSRPGCTIMDNIAYYGLDTGNGFYRLKRHTGELRMLSESSARELLSNIY